jgi:hypothetical protein
LSCPYSHGYLIFNITMKRYPHAAGVLLLGLVVAQAVATIQVYLSNVRLCRTLFAIRDAGYLPVPNQEIMRGLQHLGPAFYGGLFFTFTVGAGLALTAMAAVWLWDRVCVRNRYVSVVLCLIWAALLVGVNLRGLSPIATVYFVTVPGVVILATLWWMPARCKGERGRYGIIPVIPVPLLALLWVTQMDGYLFLDLRDHLLLSNRLGTEISDFYYRYTLYPAEAFKALNQKTLKAYSLEDIEDDSMAGSIESKLVHYDYLRVSTGSPADLTLCQRGAFLVLKRGERAIIEVTPQAFFSNTGKLLREFSEEVDTHRFFRRCTFFSLLAGFPIALYVLLFSLCRAVCGLFMSIRTSCVCASAMCLVIGIALFAVFSHSRVRSGEVRDVGEALESRRWQERAATLRLMEKGGMEASDFQAYRDMLKSPHIPVRYWLARSLAVSRKPETYDDLLSFLDDPHPNVVSMAFYALGKRGDRSAIGLILHRIETSRHWYVQWYAYKALRRLGWKQTASK